MVAVFDADHTDAVDLRHLARLLHSHVRGDEAEGVVCVDLGDNRGGFCKSRLGFGV